MPMEPGWVLAGLWVLFSGTHVTLATRPIRDALVRRCGDLGFNLVFSLVASFCFALLVYYYALHRLDGPPGFALGRSEPLRLLLTAAIVVGIVLATAPLPSYPGSAYALFRRSTQPARGIERITRHPFFVGVSLFALAHALLATRLVGTVFAAGFALFPMIGAWHQDRKLLARRGTGHADYLKTTSTFPFVAILTGRQRFVWNEIPLGSLAAGLVIAFALRAVHDGIFSRGGAFVIAAIVGGAVVETSLSWRRANRREGSAEREGSPHKGAKVT
jgi:uncharacterized membrane protein